ncbi:ThiS, thiamine-biosynthesis [gut metagenome]|uniref:ThiS, thiamine-biosynthesis n=1 Tax=gut metagenome TaxID=749906 RepID=J9H0V1_9ZZZZ
MKVKVNSKEMELPSEATLTQLTTELALPAQGVAIAVNNQMIPRNQWEGFALHENDNLVIIKAACGG